MHSNEGDERTHDYLMTEAASQMPVTNSLVLGQFSASAAASIEQTTGRTVLTTSCERGDEAPRALFRMSTAV